MEKKEPFHLRNGHQTSIANTCLVIHFILQIGEKKSGDVRLISQHDMMQKLIWVQEQKPSHLQFFYLIRNICVPAHMVRNSIDGICRHFV